MVEGKALLTSDLALWQLDSRHPRGPKRADADGKGAELCSRRSVAGGPRGRRTPTCLLLPFHSIRSTKTTKPPHTAGLYASESCTICVEVAACPAFLQCTLAAVHPSSCTT